MTRKKYYTRRELEKQNVTFSGERFANLHICRDADYHFLVEEVRPNKYRVCLKYDMKGGNKRDGRI